MSKNILFSVCGRAGSTGFPGKNLKNFMGAPLSFYSVAAAVMYRTAHPDFRVDIVLSTDSEELISTVTSRFSDVFVLRREAYLCDNVIPKLAVFTDALIKSEQEFDVKYDYYVDLDITSPIRRLCDIERQIDKKIAEPEKDLIFSAVHGRRNPYYNLVVCDDDGYVKKAIETDKFFARQQIPESYDLNASIYVFESKFVRENTSKYIWDAKCGLSLMPDTGVLDIDSKEDFLLMQAIAEYLLTTDEDFATLYNVIKN